MENLKLYYHKTDGGAEYLTDKFIVCPTGHKEGIFEGAKYIVRIDGDITKDAELTVRNEAKSDPLNEVTINPVELASECAHDSAKDEMIAKGFINDESEMWTGENYTETAQEFHNTWYDYFRNKIDEARI